MTGSDTQLVRVDRERTHGMVEHSARSAVWKRFPAVERRWTSASRCLKRGVRFGLTDCLDSFLRVCFDEDIGFVDFALQILHPEGFQQFAPLAAIELT